MTLLRRILPRSWFADIDWPRHENIDWRDDYDPNQPRVPAGQPGGGQWSGGMEGAAAATPTPGTLQVAKQGSAKKLAQEVQAHLTSGSELSATVAKLKEYGANYNYSGYASYANQLLTHLEKAHGLAPGSLGKAKAKGKLIAEPLAYEPPEQAPPSEAEMEKMAAEEPSEEPSEPEPPPDPTSPHGMLAEIMGNNWPAEEKLNWATALQGDMAESDTAGKAYAAEQIAALKAQIGHGATQAIPAEAVGPGPEEKPAPVGEKIDMGLPEPTTGTQTSVYKIFTHPTMTIGEKIDEISQKLENISHPPNLAYAKKALENLQAAYAQGEALKGGVSALVAPESATDILNEAEQKKLEYALPTPGGPQVEQDMWEAAAQKGATLAEKVKTLAELHNATASVQSKEYAKALIAHLKGEKPPEPEPEEEPEGEPNSDLPAPSALSTTQGEMWEVATHSTMSMSAMISQIKADIKSAVNPKDKEYGNKLLAVLTGQPMPAEAEPPPESTPADLPEPEPGSDKQALMHAHATDPHLSPAIKEQYITEVMNSSSFASNKAYGKSLIAALKGESAAPKPPINFPTMAPAGLSIIGQNKAAAIHAFANSDLPMAEKIANIEATKTVNTKLKAYMAKAVAAVKAHEAASGGAPVTSMAAGVSVVKPSPGAASELKPIPIPNHPKGITEIPPPTVKSPLAVEAYNIAADPNKDIWTKYDLLEKMKAGAIGSSKSYVETVSSIIGPMPGGTMFGGGAAAPEPPAEKPQPPPANLPAPAPGSNTQSGMHNVAKIGVAGGKTNTEKITAIKQLLAQSSGGAGGKAETYANELIKALGGQPTTVAEAKAEQPGATPAAAPTPASTPTPGASSATPGATPGTVATPNQMKLARARKHEANAVKVSSAKDPQAAQACRTLDRKWWQGGKNVDAATKSACESYKGGSGSINGALREADQSGSNVPEYIQKQIDLIDELFEHPDAELQQDLILHRGEDMAQADINKTIAALAAGKVVRPQRQGFTSLAAASSAPSGWTSKKVQWQVTARKGTRAIGLWAASKSFENENEVILRHGTAVEIYEVVKKGNQYIFKAHTL